MLIFASVFSETKCISIGFGSVTSWLRMSNAQQITAIDAVIALSKSMQACERESVCVCVCADHVSASLSLGNFSTTYLFLMYNLHVNVCFVKCVRSKNVSASD